MVRGTLFLLMLAASPLAAQDTAVAPPPPPPRAPDIQALPATRVPRHPQRARAQTVKAVDIPQAAKDEGHNGRATYTATVGADGKLVALTLMESSMSPAIDAAVKARAEKLYYFAATDKDGNKTEGTVLVSMAYARHDSDSPGGGIETYTCGDLVREWDWFTAANAGRRKLFWPHNAYTSLTSVGMLMTGERPSAEERAAMRASREAKWAKLIKTCRKKPARLMLQEVEEPEAYANLVNSF
ncbi:MAG: TonB family protein [Porphyrobacter sp.]|nr:TonB family protein [Porphyrobacter sp.]